MTTFPVGRWIDHLDRHDSEVGACVRARSSQRGNDLHHGNVGVAPYRVFPNPDDRPPGRFERESLAPVAGDVLGEFSPPEFVPRSRANVMRRATVPLATVHEDCDHPALEDEIRSAAVNPVVLTVAVACAPKGPAQEQLGTCAAAANASHLLGPSQGHVAANVSMPDNDFETGAPLRVAQRPRVGI